MQTKQMSNPTADTTQPIEVRLCRDLNELQACVDLQKEVWGALAALVLPLLLFEWFWFHRRT